MPIDDPWRFQRPNDAQRYLHLLADAPRRPLAIFGPRQIGKTYFLSHDLREAAHQHGWDTLYVDLWGQPEPLAAINGALSAQLRALQLRTANTPVTAVGAMGVSVSMAAPGALTIPPDPAAAFAAQIAELIRLQPQRTILLMLDEAQTLAKGSAGDLAMRAVRAAFNAHPGSIVLILTGSSRAQLLSLVGDHSKTAFKLAANMDFAALGIAFVKFIADRIEQISGRQVAISELDWAFDQLLHRPGEMIDFARFLITETPGADVAMALSTFRQRTAPDTAFEDRFAHCTPLQRAVLLLLARQAPMFSVETRRRIGAHLGDSSLTTAPSSVANALSQLEHAGVVAKLPARGSYGFEDDHFAAWCRNQPL